MADPGWKGKVETDVGQTSTFTELEKIVDCNVEALIQKILASQFNDQGERRIDGRGDFTLDVNVNFDLANSTHQAMLTAARAGSLIDVRVYPDRDDSSNYISATCTTGGLSGSIAGGSANSGTFSFMNADGSLWDFATA